MDPNQVCPRCHVILPPNSYFCFNCGKKIKDKPLSVFIPRQIFVYFCSFFLAPMGLFYGIKYLRQKGSAKIIGGICIILTVVALSLVILFTINFINTINSAINGTQLNGGANSELYNQLNNQLKDYQSIQ